MAKYRKLGRSASQRKALIRAEVTNLLHHGKIITTEAKAKEIRKVAEKLIALAVREKDNFETVTVDAKVAKKDENGKRVKEVVDGKKVTVYETVQKEIKIDLTAKLFDEYAPKYAERNGGYTRIVKIAQRKGDAALKVVLELV